MGKAPARSAVRKPPPITHSGLPAGRGVVGTGANPSPQPMGTAGAKTPNSGGIIQQGDQTHVYPADPDYSGPKPTGFLRKGAPAPLSPPNRPQQTERANPVAGAGGPPQLPGTSRTVSEAPEVDPGKAMGFSSRGNKVPHGEDRHPLETPEEHGGYMEGDPNAPGGQLATQPGDEDDGGQQKMDLDAKSGGEEPEEDEEEKIGGHVGGSGAMARKFSNPDSASVYDNFAKSMTGTPTPARIFSGKPTGKSSASMLKKGSPRDNGDESSGGEDY